MVPLPHSELVGRAAGDLELQRRLAVPLDGQIHVRGRAVDRVVLGSVGVGVDPAHEVLSLRLDGPADRQTLPGERELAVIGRFSDLCALPGPPERVTLAVEADRSVADPRRGRRAELDATDRSVDPG